MYHLCHVHSCESEVYLYVVEGHLDDWHVGLLNGSKIRHLVLEPQQSEE